MSLLEDVFLQDEADEAQDLERVIEGDEYEEIRRQNSSDDDDDGGVGRDDEAEEEKVRVDPNAGKNKRVVKNPRFVLNPARLTGPRGIHVIPEHFKDFKFKGKGHEKEDLDLVLKKLEHWAYRLYPKFKFTDCLKKIETLGKKRAVMVNLHKIRSDQLLQDDCTPLRDEEEDEEERRGGQEEPAAEDEFDKLLQQQIELARNTPARATPMRPEFGPKNGISTPFSMPKATSSPSISDEQKQRMIENRRKAEERRLARLQRITENNENIQPNNDNIRPNSENIQPNNEKLIPINDDIEPNNDTGDELVSAKECSDSKVAKYVKIKNGQKHNRSNVIDSSDSDDEKMIDENVDKEKDGVIEEVDLTEDRNVKKGVLESSDENKIDLTANKEEEIIDTVVRIEEVDLAEVRNVKRSNRSQVVDDEMDSTEQVTVEEIDLTEVRNDRKSKVLDDKINSTKQAKETIEIDLTEVSNKIINRSKVTNDFDEEIDLTEITSKAKECSSEMKEIKHKNTPHQSEIDSDSSDDECNVTTENISITVDVHKTNSAEIEDKDDFGVISYVKVNNFDAIANENASNVEYIEDSSKTKVSNDAKNIIELENNVLLSNDKEIAKKTIESQLNIDEEIMDVDFSEAF